jgi:hypothetical protein
VEIGRINFAVPPPKLREETAKLAEKLSKLNTNWPAPGSEDTELGVLMEPEVGHGATEVYARVQA